MKGLLLKELYMVKKYCRSYFLFVLVYGVLSFFSPDSFYVIFPCIFASMLPVTLMGYDERSRWDEYASTLPCTEAELVGSKYLTGAITIGSVVILTTLIQIVSMVIGKRFSLNTLGWLVATLVLVSCFGSSTCLPFMFRYGVEKGRIAYYVVLALTFAGGTVLGLVSKDWELRGMNDALMILLVLLLGVGLYFASWRISVALYRKRKREG